MKVVHTISKYCIIVQYFDRNLHVPNKWQGPTSFAVAVFNLPWHLYCSFYYKKMWWRTKLFTWSWQYLYLWNKLLKMSLNKIYFGIEIDTEIQKFLRACKSFLTANMKEITNSVTLLILPWKFVTIEKLLFFSVHLSYFPELWKHHIPKYEVQR